MLLLARKGGKICGSWGGTSAKDPALRIGGAAEGPILLLLLLSSAAKLLLL